MTKQIGEMTNEELGYHAYCNLKRIQAMRIENQAIDIELQKRIAKTCPNSAEPQKQD